MLIALISACTIPAGAAEPATVTVSFDAKDGAPWPKQFIIPETGQSFSIERNRGRVSHQRDSEGAAAVPLDPGLDGKSAYALNAAQQVRLMCPVSTTGLRGGLIARQHDTAKSTYYAATLDARHGYGLTMNLSRTVRGRTEPIATLGPGAHWETGKNYLLKFSVEQLDDSKTRLRAKMWPDGADEPAGWQIQTTDSHPALQQVIGRVGIIASTAVSSARRWYFDSYQATAVFLDEDELQSPHPRIVQLHAPGATSVAVSDKHRLAVVAQRGERQLSVFSLDDQGQPAGAPTPIALPRPTELEKHPSYALSVTFHPMLPLLYVWQDFSWPIKGAGSPSTAIQNFDHLVVYRVEAQQLHEAGRFARGGRFAHGQSEGAIAVDSENGRLYLPNLHGPGSRPAVGYLKLGTDGLPAANGEQAEPALAEVALPLPSRRDMQTSAGWGFVPGSADAVIFGAMNGACTWDQHDSRAQISWLPLPDAPIACRIAGHPGLPLVYIAGIDTRLLYRVQHARGYLTLLPDSTVISGASFQSAPLVMPGRNQLAVGDVNRVCIVSLDREGYFSPAFTMLPVASPAVRALAYSEALDLLYVPVERLEAR